MHPVKVDPCYHCDRDGHRARDCPLKTPPADKAQHDERTAEIMQRFHDLEIGPVAKQRMLRHENDAWKSRQKELAKK